ncbi:hypothetical protein [Archangium sp.]|uniref:hypothetical protein n=1 Tax=Archangium sp. TaxID=1872627 RepID=UPI00286B6AD0|nr:hypothetical protein [Archangium sp.]
MKSDTPQESEALRAVPTPGVARADAAQMVRVEAANFQRSLPLPEHPDNGDEARYPSRFASYSKGLPHDNLGDVNTVEYNKLLVAVASGNPADFEAITLGGSRQLVNPQSAYAYQLEGADSYALAVAPAPTFASRETAGEMEELYWMALARDVSFLDYAASPPVIPDASMRLNQLGVYRGPRVNGMVTADTLFRDSLPGSTVGPFISQFLLLDVPYGAQTVSQRIRTRVAGDDRVLTFSEWLRIQNGQPPAQQEALDPTPRYLRNGRDLAEFVHDDFPLQSSLNAALIISGQNDTDSDGKSSPPVHDPNNPYRQYLKQDAFATFGNADGQDLIGRIMKLALGSRSGRCTAGSARRSSAVASTTPRPARVPTPFTPSCSTRRCCRGCSSATPRSTEAPGARTCCPRPSPRARPSIPPMAPATPPTWARA